jgi:hypothetical protein
LIALPSVVADRGDVAANPRLEIQPASSSDRGRTVRVKLSWSAMRAYCRSILTEGATMATMTERARSLRERVAERRADRRKTRAERAERRGRIGDRHQQFEHRDHERENRGGWGGDAGGLGGGGMG